MWKVRNNVKIKKVFAKLLSCKTADLLPSFDGACYVPWQFSKDREQFKLWPHRDLHPSKNELVYQSSLNLIKNNAKQDGGFVAWPKTHKLNNWPDLLPITTEKDYFRIPYEINGISLKAARRFIVPPGALIVWDSRLIHCNSLPLKSNNTRAVCYVCMANKNKASKIILQERKRCMKEGLTTSHHPINFMINDE